MLKTSGKICGNLLKLATVTRNTVKENVMSNTLNQPAIKHDHHHHHHYHASHHRPHHGQHDHGNHGNGHGKPGGLAHLLSSLFGGKGDHGGHGGPGHSNGHGQNNSLSQIFGGLGKLFEGLSQMIGGGGHKPPATEKPIKGEARIWGDPHFVGADGGKYDVQGEAGKTYNLLSDKGFQMNGTFEKYKNSDTATVVGKVGITAGANYIQVDKSGAATVNGRELKDGQRIRLEDGGYAERKGNDITVKKGEWEVNFQARGHELNMDVKTENAIADGVRPHGLLGQTFDGDGKARNGDTGSGAQGGGAIEGLDGKFSSKGDKNTVRDYEVSNLYDTHFQNHNRDYGQWSMLEGDRGNHHHGAGNRGNDQMREMTQQLGAMMVGFSILFNSMFSQNFANTSSNYGSSTYS